MLKINRDNSEDEGIRETEEKTWRSGGAARLVGVSMEWHERESRKPGMGALQACHEEKKE